MHYSIIKVLSVVVLCFIAFNFTACSDNKNKYDMSSLNNDMDDESDFEEYIADAKRSARNENFSSAYSYLKKARMLGVSNSELSSAKSYVTSKKRAYEERIERERQARLERERQERMARQSQSYSGSSSSLYITSWGYDFSGDDRIWGQNGVKLSNGSEFYVWLKRESYGSRCYNLSVLGSITGNGSNCSGSINNTWAVYACGSGQFFMQGNQSDVVKAIVSRCGN